MGIWEELKYNIRHGTMLSRLIFINVGVFLVLRIVHLFYFLAGVPAFPLVEWLSLPASLSLLVKMPWTVITYMFLHFDLLHALFNLFCLYWFGKIFLDYFDGPKLLSVYIVGGICGAVFFVAGYNLFPVFRGVVHESMLLGASASIFSILVALAFFVPNHRVDVLFLGSVRIKYIALVFIVLYVVGISTSNPGGNVAHIGGAFWGMIYVYGLKRGKNYGRWISDFFAWSGFRTFHRTRMSVTFRQNRREFDSSGHGLVQQKEVDRILDKIGRSGYESLTRGEKDLLFKTGKK